MTPHRALLLLACLLATPASAGIDVTISGVDGALRENVVAFLSLVRYANSPDLDQERVDRLAQRAEREARSALRPFGYYDPVVVATIAEGESPDSWKAEVKVTLGEPVMLAGAETQVTGPGRDEAFLREVLENFALKVGSRLSHGDYDALKAALQRAAASYGYLDAAWTRASLEVDPVTREAHAFLTLDTGERYRFGATEIEQDFLDPDLVRRYLRYREGDWYDAVLLLRTQFALDDSEYFSVVEVLPEARDRVAKTVPVRIDSEKNKRYRYRVGGGYATDTQWRLLLGWTNRQVNRRGHRLSAEARLSGLEQRIDLNYVIPWTDPALEKLSLRLLTGSVDSGDVTTRGVSFRPGLTQVRGRWQRVLFTNLDYTRDTLPNPTGTTVSSVATQRNLLLVPGISYALLPPGFIAGGAAGRGLYGELSGSTSALGSDSDFLRLVVRDERRFDLGGPWHLTARAEVGTSAVGDFQDLPAQYRFFAGGDRSVRGYGYNELSPVDAEGNRVGGRHLVIASLEIERDLPRNFGVAAFVDGGNAFNRFGDPLEYSVGLGIRYRLPFVSVGLDVAQSISQPDRSPRVHFNFTPLL